MTPALGAAFVASYFLGAIPTSYLVVKQVKGIDLRTFGSGNLGATNLYRLLGWRYAIPVAAFDALKGAIPAGVLGPAVGAGLVVSLLLGATAVVGHVYSVFVGFKGGKGVATSAGVVAGLAPAAFGASLALWTLMLWLSGYVSIASISAAVALPAAIWLLQPNRRSMIPWFAALALAIIWLHRGNIRRLLAGNEHRFGARAASVSKGVP